MLSCQCQHVVHKGNTASILIIISRNSTKTRDEANLCCVFCFEPAFYNECKIR